MNLPAEIWWPCADQCGARFGEFRFIGIDRPAQQKWVDLSRYPIIEPTQRVDYNSYFGVIPRQGHNSVPIEHTHWLWADFDDRQDFLFQAVHKFKAEPSVIVDSGRGMQVYWRLAAPMPNDMASTVMKGIAKMHNGDHTHDAPRILRVPGSINRKNGQMARTLVHNLTIQHPWGEFIDYAEAGVDRPTTRVLQCPECPITAISRDQLKIHLQGYHKVTPIWDGPFLDNAPQWLQELWDQDPGKGQRSEHAYRVVCAMVELGYDFDAIEDVFGGYPQGVGAKYHEKGRNGTQWLQTTYQNASRNI